MTVQLSHEHSVFTADSLETGELSPLPIPEWNSGELQDSGRQTIEANHEYELAQSESVRFLYDLLYDEQSNLSKSEILDILEALKKRENTLPFSFANSENIDVQGMSWPVGLKEKFFHERFRVGNQKWFHNIPGSRNEAFKNINIKKYKTKTDFFEFQKFFSKLKIHITHFQLRNLICCGPSLSNGIFYPSSYLHDHNLQTVGNNVMDDTDTYHNFFKINRLMQDEQCLSRTSVKLDCLIDSRNLLRNSNSRISTMQCSEKFLVSGTFEGGYILQDISKPNETKLLGEYVLTNNADGITNHIIIDDDKKLIVSSNDQYLRFVDLSTSFVDSVRMPFAINCVALNPHNENETFVTGDHVNPFIIDRRAPLSQSTLNLSNGFLGHSDFGFSCDWSPCNENLLLSGNQDGSVRLWDRRRQEKSLYSWSGSLGSEFSDVQSSSRVGGPVRNTKFSNGGEFICWAESLDHIGIIQTDDLLKSSPPNLSSRVQSIDFVGKCIGINFVPSSSGNGENLIAGVSDCPLGGILNYQLDRGNRSLDFDFFF